MRIGKPSIEAYTASDRATGRESKAFRVRWRVYGPGKPQQLKQGGFRRKGEAERFCDNLRKAALMVDGWQLLEGRPVHADQIVPEPVETVLEALDVFVRSRWNIEWRSPDTKAKNRGRLLLVVATLLTSAEDSAAVLAELPNQVTNRGLRRDPTSPAGWAARWLHDFALDPGRDGEPIPADVAAGAGWLALRSMPVEAVCDRDVLAVRAELVDGRPHSTARTYWSICKAFFGWLVTTDRAVKDPCRGLPDIRRDLNAERVDPRHIPEEAEMWQIADAMGDTYSHARRTLVVAQYFTVSRLGEALALRRRDIRFLANGGAIVRIAWQDRRAQKRYSADGSTRATRLTKGRHTKHTSSREVVVPTRAAAVLRAHLATLADSPDTRLFTGARGGPLDADYYRRAYWTPVINRLFGPGHRLSELNPHDLRHGGLTIWLNSGVPVATCQKMGGWHSLKVMLDTYAAVLPSDTESTLRALENTLTDNELDVITVLQNLEADAA